MNKVKRIISVMLIAVLLGGTAALFSSCASDGFLDRKSVV